jgi:hypothetical protein
VKSVPKLKELDHVNKRALKWLIKSMGYPESNPKTIWSGENQRRGVKLITNNINISIILK